MIASPHRVLLLSLFALGCACTPISTPQETTNAAQHHLIGSDTTLSLPFNARGNEPGWSLTLDRDLTLRWQYGAQKLNAPLPRAKVKNGSTHYQASDGQHQINITMTPDLCHDDMSGMPYPVQVKIHIKGADNITLHGCGGDSASLLTSTEWQVEDIAQRGIIDSSHLTLVFDNNQQLSGHASCNYYHTSYTLSGEGLTINPHIASTMKACVPALNNQESRFLDALKKVQRFDFGTNGKLLLYSNAKKVITATRLDNNAN